MKKLARLFTILTLIAFAASFTFTACGEDEEDPDDTQPITSSGTATVGGETYTFSQGILQHAGEFGDVNVYALMLASANLNYATYSGTGDAMYFQVNTNSSTFNGGDFTIGTSMEPNVIDSAVFVIGLQLPPNADGTITTAGTYIPTPGGTVSITKTGEVYDIVYNLPAIKIENGLPVGADTITGSYSGELK